jgi:hypothetical protein
VGLLVDGVLFDQWYDSKSTGLENAQEALRAAWQAYQALAIAVGS